MRNHAVSSGTQELLPKSELRPGDVLLSCGSSGLSELIRRIDGGLYSHAAMWDGAFAVDATGHGVVRNPLEHDMEAQWYIDAYRWHVAPADGPDLGIAPHLTKPVLDETDKIVESGAVFAYDQLILAALVILVSKQPAERWLRIAVRLLLSQVEVWIVEKIRKPGKTAMVCSETVARSFGQAARPPDYTIKVIVDGSRDAAAIVAAVERERALLAGVAAPLPDTPVSSYDALKRRYGELIVRDMTEDERGRLSEFAAAHAVSSENAVRLMESGDRGLPPQCVTPRDLQRSPNLRKLGRLSENPAPIFPKSSVVVLLQLLWGYLKSKVKRAFSR